MSEIQPALTDLEQKAIDLARAAQRHAHAPYSGKFVGAAVITQSGLVFAGCNVENALDELKVCAERNAIGAAIAAGDGALDTVVVVSPDDRLWPPCESCRRVIGEFAPTMRIIMTNRDGVVRRAWLEELGSKPFPPR